MVTEAPSDLTLTTLRGQSHTLLEWLTTFHLVAVILDPFTSESAWLLPSVGRILRTYTEADCRVAILVTCTSEEAHQFLGPYAKEFLTFVDPDRSVVKSLEVDRLPAIVHIRQDLSIAGATEGWRPAEWREITENLSRAMSWTRPTIPGPRDPGAYEGTPALG